MTNTLYEALHNPARLQALDETGLLDTLPEESFDRFTRLATKLLPTPVALISLVTPERQFFKSAVGLGEPWASLRETPLSHSFCQYVVERGTPLVISDARKYPLVRDNLAITDLNVIAYVGVPLVSAAGHVLGAFCAISNQPRVWTAEELGTLEDLAAALIAEIQLREALGHLQHQVRRTEALYEVARAITALDNLATALQQVVDSAAAALQADRVTILILDQSAQQITHRAAGGPGASQVVAISYEETVQGLTGWVLRTAQPVLSAQTEPDARESLLVQQRRAATACGAIMVVPLRHRAQVLGTITAINRPKQPVFGSTDLALLTAVANQAGAAIANVQLFAQVQHLAITDSLTSLYNRRGFFLLGEREIERARRLEAPVAVVMLDIDHFKRINDTFGHAAGDQVLQSVAAQCQGIVRQADLLGRLGGEEFAVLLPTTTLATAAEVAERMRALVAERPVVIEEATIPVTISLGVAEARGREADLATLLAQADAALYRAKTEGRNRVLRHITSSALDQGEAQV
ncbi:MAG: diguanylate cyclase [Ardenticatenales bacterium]|nr:diguanylate cyclase [Ardenticatenales bacterium]